MRYRCLNLDEFASIYKSCIFLLDMKADDATQLVYDLNTANLDTLRGLCDTVPCQSAPLRFYTEINRRGRPFRSLSAFADALEELRGNIAVSFLTESQRAAVKMLERIIDEIEDRRENAEDILIDAMLRAFFKACG